jgi:hypothetical protein
MIQWNLWNPTTAGTKDISLLLYLNDTVEPLKPDYDWDQRHQSVIISTWYSGTSETRLRLGPKKSVCYYSYMIVIIPTWYNRTSETRLTLGSTKSVSYYIYMKQWNLWSPNTAGTNETGLLLYLHDTMEPLKPENGWDQRNRSIIIFTWYSGTSETRLRLGPKKLVC